MTNCARRYGRIMKQVDALPDYLRPVYESGADKTTGLMCPSCNGGASQERSLGVYRIDNRFVLKCYRLKCGYSEQYAVQGDAQNKGIPFVSYDTRQFTGELETVSKRAGAIIERWYGIRRETLLSCGVKLVKGLPALYLPVWDRWAVSRGAVVRRLDDWGRKADAYKTSNEPWLAWYDYDAIDPALQKPLLIVEDQLSAMRLWQLGYPAVALLGVNLSADKAAEIHRWGEAWIALDADAFTLACDYAKRYAWIKRVVRLEHDIKDISDMEIIERLHG